MLLDTNAHISGTEAELSLSTHDVGAALSSRRLTEEHIDALFREIPFSSTAALNKLSEHYMPLVNHHAQSLHSRLPPSVELSDLIQSGYFGLRDAILAYDLERGIKFETYCATRIRGAMLDSIREADWLPRLVRKEIRILDEARETLERELQREPDDTELLHYFKENSPEKMSAGLMELIRSHRSRGIGLQSLETKKWETDSGGERTMGSLLADARTHSPDEKAINDDLRRTLLRGCSTQERLLYILYIVEELPMAEVGEHLGLSESRISQMFSEMICKLQDRVISSQHSTRLSEYKLIDQRFKASQHAAEEDASARDISAEVIRKLDALNSQSSVNFSWIDRELEYQNPYEKDRDISRLVQAVATERTVTPKKIQTETSLPAQSTSPVEPSSAETPDLATSLADFRFFVLPTIPTND